MNAPSVGARFVKEAPMTAAARTLGCAIAFALVSQCLASPLETDSMIRFRDATEWTAANRNAKPPTKLSMNTVDPDTLNRRQPTR
jgi:hypothetical protein